MAQQRHTSLFHPRLVRNRIASLDPDFFQQHKDSLAVWINHLRTGACEEINEVSLHAGFLERIFGDVLGYRTMATAQGDQWDMVAEKTVASGGTADGALGFFEKGKDKCRVVAPIELNGASQFLEHARGRSLTPIQRGWDYANKTPESRWIIVSNYRETRLYAKSRGQSAYEVFHLDEIATEEGFLRFLALLGRDALLGGPSVDQSPVALMLLASERTEMEITNKLYANFRSLRSRLYDELRKAHSNIPAVELIPKAQTILDRVLFVAFAEDRQLLPPNTLAKAFEHCEPYLPRPVWQNFLSVFRSIDKGNAKLGIPAYNGGLFRDIEAVEELVVSDETCAKFRELGDYDFREDVSVEVLGHIFEQSIGDLESLRAEASTADSGSKQISERKREGIYYTPPFVTQYLVRETLGRAFSEAWERAGGLDVSNKRSRIAAWEAYQNELRTMRVLDPACGSGAFLVAAFDALAHEFERSNRALDDLHGKNRGVFDLTKAVLSENLFGIDKSGESVEITRLSLWLKTAEYGKKLTYIDRNIRQGNSVVSDPLIDPWAFDWNAGRVAQDFLEYVPPNEDADQFDARWREGFDVVIGNPPYVRQELLTPYKAHWKESFRAYNGTADLFVYFFERGMQQLKPGGWLGFIVSNKWLRSGYAEKLRGMLASTVTIEQVVDFGHAPIFLDADAFPSIVVLRKMPPPKVHTVQVTRYPREDLGKEQLASYIESHRFAMTQDKLGKAGWTLEHRCVLALLDKLRERGVPLSEYVGVKPHRGVLTGCNDAFLVDQATKERLCREDPRSAEILKKYLRGRDVARWSPQWDHLWIVLLMSSGNHQWPWSGRSDEEAERVFSATYSSIYRHMKQWEEQLQRRSDQGRYWWEIRSCAYYAIFERTSIIYPEIMWRADFALAECGTYLNNTSYVLPSIDKWLLACLNSPGMWYYFWCTAQRGKDDALRMLGGFLPGVPIPRPSAEQADHAANAVQRIVDLSRSVADQVAATLDVLDVVWAVDARGQALSTFDLLGSDAFVSEVNKRRGKEAGPLSPRALGELRTLFEAEAPPLLEKRAEILRLERALAGIVHAAWGLDAGDLAMLRATAPPRMPPGW